MSCPETVAAVKTFRIGDRASGAGRSCPTPAVRRRRSDARVHRGDTRDHRYASAHRFVGDAYAPQHPGVPERRKPGSVAVHSISLHLALEKGVTSDRTMKAMRRAADRSAAFVWLDPPAFLGDVVVLDVLEAKELAEHKERVEGTVTSVWEAWSPHHEAVRRWAQL